MSEKGTDFANEIEYHQSAETVSDKVAEVRTEQSSLAVRLRGCFVTECQLTNPLNGQRVDILHTDPNLKSPAINSSHVMMPVGPSEAIGGRHGFPRWADYHEFTAVDTAEGQKRLAFQAVRSDLGLGLAKVFVLADSVMTSHTTAFNSEGTPAATSLGEHLYFNLKDANTNGLKINDLSLDQLLGEGSTKKVMDGGSIFWPDFTGNVVIDFPAGHSVELHVETDGADLDQVGMLVWHRPNTESICFEPTLGLKDDNSNKSNKELIIEPYGLASLSTSIKLLPK